MGTKGRGALKGALVVGVIAGLLVGGTVALLSWGTTVYDSAGGRCATAFHYHPGSGYLPIGGEMTVAERRQIAEGCDEGGATAWRRGWVALWAGVAPGAACAAALIVLHLRRRGET